MRKDDLENKTVTESTEGKPERSNVLPNEYDLVNERTVNRMDRKGIEIAYK